MEVPQPKTPADASLPVDPLTHIPGIGIGQREDLSPSRCARGLAGF
jgi:hypothetical protein